MTAPRTVTVQTRDHGPVTRPEPGWCIEPHPDGQFRVDLTHAGPVTELTVSTSRGEATLLAFALELRPFTERPPGTEPFVNVEICGDWYPHTFEAFARLGDRMASLGDDIRVAAAELGGRAAGES